MQLVACELGVEADMEQQEIGFEDSELKAGIGIAGFEITGVSGPVFYTWTVWAELGSAKALA